MKRFLVSILLLSCISIPCFSRKIYIIGKWGHLKRSIEVSLPIEAFIDENTKELSLLFSEDLGFVNVLVTNSQGAVVHTELLDATQYLNWNLELRGVNPSDSYTLVITDGYNLLEGEFSIQ